MLKKFFGSDLIEKDYSSCSGCGVCALVCPVWTHSHDIALTPWGRAKAIQGGATAQEIRNSIDSCLSCGACHTVCPEQINVPEREEELRRQIGRETIAQELPLGSARINFFPSSELKAQSERLARLKPVLERLASARELITDNFLWQSKLMKDFPKKKVFGLGHWLLSKNLIQPQLEDGDFYWMDAPLFHNQYEQLVAYYAEVSRKTKCILNWTLHRTAMPLGADSPFFQRQQQFEWVLHQREIKRIVVESTQDWEWISTHSQVPVVHVLDLVGGA